MKADTPRSAFGSIERDLLVPYGLRALRIGLQASVLALTALAIYPFLPGRGEVAPAPYLIIWGVAAVGAVVIAVLPWERLWNAGVAPLVSYAWSFFDIVLITAAVGITGGIDSTLWAFYALTTVYFAAWYPGRVQAALLLFSSLAYVTVIVLGDGPVPVGTLFIRLAVIGVLAFAASFLSRELLHQMSAHSRARDEADRRATLVGTVAAAARNMTTLGPRAVLNAVVEGATTLGFEAAAICLLDDDARTYRVISARGMPEAYTSATHDATRGLIGLTLESRQTVVLNDYSALSDATPIWIEQGIRACLATPIDSVGGPVAILTAGTREERRLAPRDVEAFELLAAQAARALATAHEFEDLQKAQEALRESEAKYRAVMEQAGDGIYIVGFDRRFIEVNRTAAEMLGYSREELIGLTIDDVADPQHIERHPPPLEDIKAGRPMTIERLMRKKDGSPLHVEIKSNKLDEERFVAIVRDITSVKDAQEALETRERLFRAVSELTSDYAYSMKVNPDYSLEWEWVTAGFRRLFGITPEQMDAQGGWETLVHPDDLEMARGIFQRLIEHGAPIGNELRMLGSDGATLNVRSWMDTERDADGRVMRLFGAIQDITERKKAEEDLQAQKDLYESLVSAQSDLGEGVTIVDLTTQRYLYVNDAICRMYGYRADELLAMPSFLDVLLPAQREDSERGIQQRLAGGRVSDVHQFTALRKNGLPIEVEIVSKPLEDGKLIALVRDITERKLAEERLRESEKRYRNLYDRIPIAIYQRTRDGGGIDANPAAVELFGYPDKESFLTVPARDFWVDPTDRDRWVALMERDGIVENFETMLRRADGSVLCARNSGRAVYDLDGRFLFYEASVQDVTDIKEKEEELERSNSLLRATLESTADGILVVDKEAKIVAYNRKFAEMWRLPEEVLESRDDDRAISVVLEQLSDPDGFVQDIRRLYDTDEESLDMIEFKDGRLFERYSQPQVLEGQVVGRVWSFRDVTVREESARALRDSSRRLRAALELSQKADEERRRLVTHLVKAKEDERNRVAADIHDDSVQVMTSVALALERMTRQEKDPHQKQVIGRLEESVRAAIGRLRTMVFELRPPALDEEGLASALALYLEEFKLDSGIDFSLVNELPGEPAPELRVTLYRIAQEALTNVRKHSNATRVTVWLREGDGGIALTVADDGVGFSTAVIDETLPGHIG
ncbi:MAG: PAS domain S-box protein, partial [Actinomycetota bacterium]|nr:PAS domain S-box protein [Actinomycetota bacterium]